LVIFAWAAILSVRAGGDVTLDTTVGSSFTFTGVDSPTKTLGALDPGTPVTADTTLTLEGNDVGGYVIKAVKQGTDTTLDLQSDDTVNITDKTAWTSATPNSVEWSGTGLGFRVKETGTEANYWSTTWWGADAGTPLFAGFPTTTSETISTYAGYTSTEFYVLVQYKLDVATSQKTGTYDGGVTYTATAN